MKLRNILLISLILIIFSSIGGCFAAEDNVNLTDIGSNDHVFKAEDKNGDKYYGYCLNSSKQPPKKNGSPYNISEDTSNINPKIKNMIIKYYRDDGNDSRNLILQHAIWRVQNPNNYQWGGLTEYERTLATTMMNDQTGVVGNSYTDPNTGITYTFKFFYGKLAEDDPKWLYDDFNYSDMQDIIFFQYENSTGKNETPSIGTNARNNATGDRNAISDGIVTIIDNVSYKNLKQGQEYTITGYLMYKNGSYVMVNGQRVTATKTFNATSANGNIELEFRFNATGLGNTSIVVFEFLTYSNGTDVTNHTDLNDPNQTVNFTEPPEEPKEPKTNEPNEPYTPVPPETPIEPNEPVEPNEPDTPDTPTENIPPVTAKMKPSGIPIIAMILILLTSLGLIAIKKE